MNKIYVLLAVFTLTLFSCKTEKNAAPNATSESKPSKKVTPGNAITPLTDENFALAESQMIFAKYVKDIAKVTQTNGVGVFMHNKKAANPKDTTVVRINFDTKYSIAILDLKEEAILTMPETNGRYQSAWFITEEHYNPMAVNAPGTYKISQDNIGARYVMLVVRTQVNMQDSSDLAKVSELQDQLQLEQKDRGVYEIRNRWDREKVLEMRKKYQALTIQKNITSDKMFGKKGETTLENHNAGVSTGWGGMTPQQAVYPNFKPKNSNPAMLVLKEVPVAAFWSITVYDAGGFVKGNKYNINSSFAKPNNKGEFIIHFGGDTTADNYLDVFDGWNFILRMYEPTDTYFNGSWKVPELVQAE